MQFFMFLYLAVALIFILKKSTHTRDTYILMLLGATLIGMTFFENYNFADFSKMQFFVSLISALLIYALTLQKVTKKLNIYLKLSPVLLMMLGFFFFDSITMLLYSIFTLFVFVVLYMWHAMKCELVDALKLTARLFILSLPLVLVLFMVFPRISIEKADFGFRSDVYSVSGYDGKMSVTANEVRLSNKVVMEVLFADANISEQSLYFRGTTLYEQEGLEWKKSQTPLEADFLVQKSSFIEYEVTIYPHGDNWFYALDMPLQAHKDTRLNFDSTLSLTKPLHTKKKFQLSSALKYKLFSQNSLYALDVEKNEQTFEALQKIKTQNISDYEKALLLMAFFKEQKISYALAPKGLDLDSFLDSFLFSAKSGYCVHFASAFAQSARMLDIPSRVVTGYKPKKESMIQNYLLVKESDAHAWVELYLKEYGWVRFDPTATAMRELSSEQAVQNEQSSRYFQTLNDYYMYTKYMINNWVLGYDRAKQIALLDKLLSDTLYLLQFLLIFTLVLVALFLLFISIKHTSSNDPLMCEMDKLLKRLKKHKLHKNPHESMQTFLQRSQGALHISLENISNLYHVLKYKKDKPEVEVENLKNEIKTLMTLLKNRTWQKESS